MEIGRGNDLVMIMIGRGNGIEMMIMMIMIDRENDTL